MFKGRINGTIYMDILSDLVKIISLKINLMNLMIYDYNNITLQNLVIVVASFKK